VTCVNCAFEAFLLTYLLTYYRCIFHSVAHQCDVCQLLTISSEIASNKPQLSCCLSRHLVNVMWPFLIMIEIDSLIFLSIVVTNERITPHSWYMYCCEEDEWPMCIVWHFDALNIMAQHLAHCSSLTRSCCNATWSSVLFITLYICASLPKGWLYVDLQKQ